jgi:hypothetical protein
MYLDRLICKVTTRKSQEQDDQQTGPFSVRIRICQSTDTAFEPLFILFAFVDLVAIYCLSVVAN